MQPLTITVSAPNASALAAEMLAIGTALSGATGTTTQAATTDAAEPTKTKRTKKAAAPATEEPTFEDGAETFDLGEDETPEAPATTLQDVVAAFKTFVGGNKAKASQAGQILSRYGVKSVKDLKPEQYAKVITALGV